MSWPRVRSIVRSSALLLWGVTWVGAPSGFAQWQDPQDEGINLGRVILRPSLTVEVIDDSNVFYGSQDLAEARRVSSGVLVARPRLMFDLPFRDHRLRWAYAPIYRDYTSDRFTQADRLSHFFDLEATLSLGPSVSVAMRDHFVKGTVELQEIDRGGELTFGLVPFVLHEPQVELTMAIGARHGLSLIGRSASTRFDEEADDALYNYRREGLEARYNFLSSPSTLLYAYHSFDDTAQNRDEILFGDVALDSRVIGVGLRRSNRGAVSTAVSAGYQTMDFEGGSASAFSGLSLDASTTWQLSDVSRVEGVVRRAPYQSFFVNNNYYVGDYASVRFSRQVGRRMYWRAGVGLQRFTYADKLDIRVTPETDSSQDLDANGEIDAFETLATSAGRRRRDLGIQLELGAGYHFLRTLRVFVGYNHQRRESNIDQSVSGELIDPFNYSVHRAVMRIEMGWQ